MEEALAANVLIAHRELEQVRSDLQEKRRPEPTPRYGRFRKLLNRRSLDRRKSLKWTS